MVDILKKLHAIKITFTLDNILVIIVIGFILFEFCYKFLYKKLKPKVRVKTITVGGVSIDLECNNEVRKLANDVWIELSTRKIAIPFDEDNDVIIEVYNSWYITFTKIRETLKKIPIKNNKDVIALTNILLETLNTCLRGHLTKWQARFRKWYDENKSVNCDPQEIQKKYPQYRELISDLKAVNVKMINLTNELNNIRKGS